MEYKEVDFKDIKPYPNNPRVNSAAVKYVRESIIEFGYRNPIAVDRNMVIINGHTRHKAMSTMPQYKNSKIKVLLITDLDDEQIRKLRLVDNKVSEKSIWDLDKLNVELDILPADFKTDFFNDFNIDEETKEDNELLPPTNEMCEHRYKCTKCNEEL